MRLLINMYLLPISLVISAYLLISSGYRFEDVKYLGQFAVYPIGLGKAFALAAVLLAITRTWTVWRAFHGKGNLCDLCGYPVKYIANGRYGPYFKCWSCGTNRADHS